MTESPTATTLSSPRTDQWLADRLEHASRELDDCVELNPEKLGGIPVLKGTRISVAQIMAEIGEGSSAAEVSADFDLDVALVKRLVKGLALCLDRPVLR